MAPPSKGSDDGAGGQDEDGENYSSPKDDDSSDGNDVRFLDINDLKKQREDTSDKKRGDDNYEDDDFI